MHPVYNTAMVCVVKYLICILTLDHRYVRKAYNMMYTLDKHGLVNWVTGVRSSLQRHSFGNIWLDQRMPQEALFLAHFKQRLIDKYLQDWSAMVRHISKLSTYAIFKHEHKLQLCLDCLTIQKLRSAISRLQISSHKLAIE